MSINAVNQNSAEQAAAARAKQLDEERAQLSQPAAGNPDFGALMQTLFGKAVDVGSMAAGPMGQLLRSAGSAAGLSGTSALTGSGDQMMQMLQMQMQVQQQTTVYQGISNISKTDHESRINAVRNMKA